MKKSTKSEDKGSEDKGQSSIFDFGSDLLSDEEKKQINQIIEPQIQHVSHDNHIKETESNLRSEQIHISKENYPSISMNDNPKRFSDSIDNISKCNHFSKNIFNQCLFQIRQSFFNKIDLNVNNEKEKKLRIDIRSALNKCKNYPYEKLKSSNYKNQIYKLLDKYFKDESKIKNIYGKNDNDNYSWSPGAAQQIIDMSVEAWLDNDLARRDYKQQQAVYKEHPEHRVDYTGEPGICNYRRGNEYISVFSNQQCIIETKDVLIIESMNEERLRYVKKNFVTFPDHLNIKPVETRLSDNTDLREVRIIPQTCKGCYKVELVYKKVVDKIKIKLLNLDPNRIIGIDTGQENVVTAANNIGKAPIIIKGGILLAINQWFDKIGSKLYSIYSRQQSAKADNCYRQQKFNPNKESKESKGQKVIMGEKMKILSQNRTNTVLDILHKISRYIINYCINNRIGTIVWGRNPGWKQNISLGKKTNQKFTKIPHYLLFKLIKYKAEEIGIKVIDIEESHTSKCSFLDLEPIGHKEKGQYVGKRIKRGLFKTLKGIIWNADVNAAYNMIKKVIPDAFDQFVRNGELILKTVGIVTSKDEGVVLHPLRLSVSDLL